MVRRFRTLATAIAILFTTPVLAQETIDSRIGPLSFTHGFTTGYPTNETIAKLYDEMDFQRAVQAYLWSDNQS